MKIRMLRMFRIVIVLSIILFLLASNFFFSDMILEFHEAKLLNKTVVWEMDYIPQIPAEPIENVNLIEDIELVNKVLAFGVDKLLENPPDIQLSSEEQLELLENKSMFLDSKKDVSFIESPRVILISSEEYGDIVVWDFQMSDENQETYRIRYCPFIEAIVEERHYNQDAQLLNHYRMEQYYQLFSID